MRFSAMAWDHGDVSAASNTCGAYRDGQFTGIASQFDHIVHSRNWLSPSAWPVPITTWRPSAQQKVGPLRLLSSSADRQKAIAMTIEANINSATLAAAVCCS
jgi:hypothetical protein